KYNLCIVSPLNTILFLFHWGSERGVSVTLAWGCAKLSYLGSSPDMNRNLLCLMLFAYDMLLRETENTTEPQIFSNNKF
ncbi:hypothetical protein T09_7092, partial [Trichinella sp. T9]